MNVKKNISKYTEILLLNFSLRNNNFKNMNKTVVNKNRLKILPIK